MNTNSMPQKDAITNDVSSHISGMPTIAELRKRVSMRQQKVKKGGTGKKTAQQ